MLDNESAASNLRNEAKKRGVAPERLVFAGRVPYQQHLERHHLADLFLDTLPYNAGATASDALWAGLPVLTCAGKSFAARMGASLLNAVGLPEMITGDLASYEARATRLATDPPELARDQVGASIQSFDGTALRCVGLHTGDRNQV